MKTIDAKNKSLGRVASEAAKMLMGKDDVSYEANKVAEVKVNITNASKLKITEKKRQEKLYMHYTGYPGGLRKEKLESLVGRKGYKEILQIAIKGMLPANKLRPLMLKNLTIID